MTTIQSLNLQHLNAQYAQELKEVAQQVIDSGWYLLGNRVATFEQQLATYLEVPHVVGVANGLDALRLIFRGYIALGVMQQGDEVIVPANTFIATILAITQAGLVPVFAEPSEETHNLDLTTLSQYITSRTRAICVVHLYGRCCWGEQLQQLTTQYNLKVVEDNAQALGATYTLSGGVTKRCGALGDAAGISFYPAKNLGALGDAGAVITNDAALADVVRALGNYGSKQKYHNLYEGYNSRMDELQAALLSVKLKYLDRENQIRAELAHNYAQNLSHPEVILPQIGVDGELVWHQYVVRTARRDELQGHLAKCGVETLIHYPIPPHKQQCYPQYNHLHLPVAEMLAQQVLSLPISPLLTSVQQGQVIEAVNGFV